MLLQVFDDAFRKDFPCVTRWFQTCVHQPPFKAVLKEVQLCKERQQGKGERCAYSCMGGPSWPAAGTAVQKAHAGQECSFKAGCEA